MLRSLRDIARLDEARQALSKSELADEWRPFANGRMCRAKPGLWSNTALGAGMDGPVDPAEVDTLIAFYAEHAIEPRVELTPFADESLRAALEARGFVLRAFMMVLWRELDATEQFIPAQPVLPGLQISELDPADGARVREVAVATIASFNPPGKSPTPAQIEASERAHRHPRMRTFIAELPDDSGQPRLAGAGMLERSGEVASLMGMATVPWARRRGVQQALIATRLREAVRTGATFATIGSRPDSPTERNVRRMGFAHAYTKAMLVRPGPGLTTAGG